MERVASSLANELSRDSNLRIYLITLTNQPRFFQLEKNVNIIQPNTTKNQNFIIHSIKTIIFLRKTIQIYKPKSVLSFGDRYNSIVILSGLFSSTKVFISNRQNPYHSNGKFIDTLNRLLYPYSKGLICQTKIAANVFRLCVRAGFLALHLIRRTALQLYTKLSIETHHPA